MLDGTGSASNRIKLRVLASSSTGPLVDSARPNSAAAIQSRSRSSASTESSVSWPWRSADVVVRWLAALVPRITHPITLLLSLFVVTFLLNKLVPLQGYSVRSIKKDSFILPNKIQRRRCGASHDHCTGVWSPSTDAFTGVVTFKVTYASRQRAAC